MQHDLLTLRLSGAITALSPVSYAAPDLDKANKGKMPTLGGCLFLTAQSIRSVIRHGATRSIYNLMGVRPGLDDYLLSAQGGVMNAKGSDPASAAAEDAEDDAGDSDDTKKEKESKEDKAAVLRMRYAREHNPMLTLFGSMAQGIPGALYCGHALADPAVKAETVRLIRANDFRRDPELFDSLDAGAMDDFLRMQDDAARRSALRTEKKAVKKQAAKGRNAGLSKAEMDALNDRINSIDKELETANTVSLSMPSNYEVIPQDTVFAHDISLVGVSPLEISLFLMGLRDWAAEPFIGGKRFHGLGRVKAQWTVTGRAGRSGALQPMGAVSFGGDFGDLSVEGDIAKFAADALAVEAIRSGALDLSQASLTAIR